MSERTFKSEEVFDWPEFKALAERLGIDLKYATTTLRIDLTVGHLVEVQHEYFASSGIEADLSGHFTVVEESNADVDVG